MERTESTLQLLENDQLNSSMDQPCSEGSSSGYESSEISDTESSDHGFPPSPPCHSIEDVDDSEHVKYQSTSALCDHLKYILSMPELCDVTFHVGPNKNPIHGVKAILGTRSRVMYQLILKNERRLREETKSSKKSRKFRQTRLTIDVSKYTPEDFENIILFIHCGSVDITARNVTGLLCGASQFELEDLKMACWDFIHRCMQRQPEALVTIQRGANQYIHHRYGIKIFTKIEQMKKCLAKKCNPQTPLPSHKMVTTV